MMATPKWSLSIGEYCERLGISRMSEIDCFDSVLRIEGISRIVPLRYLKRAITFFPLQRQTLTELIRKVPTKNGKYPFTRAVIAFRKIDSQQLYVGQRFAYREQYQSIVEGMPHLFENIMGPHGMVDLGAQFVLGEDKEGALSLACYIPPLVERHGEHLVIMDGIHRNYLAKQIGATVSAIFVEHVDVPFPCEPHPWSELSLATQKPENIHDRFFDLREELFRDLKFLGIDG